MSYFQKSAEYYIMHIGLSGPENRRILGERCRAKYARGINLVAVESASVGHTFTPGFFVDPGRIFLTYERLVKEAFDKKPDETEHVYKEIKRLIETYDPLKELLFFVVKCGSKDGEGYVYRVPI
jgi:hypothetical protein